MTQAPETPQIFEGELLKVDATAQTLSVKSSEGQEMEFRYSDQTLISGAEGGVEGLATKSGTPVIVHFDTATRTAADGGQTALRDCLPDGLPFYSTKKPPQGMSPATAFL